MKVYNWQVIFVFISVIFLFDLACSAQKNTNYGSYNNGPNFTPTGKWITANLDTSEYIRLTKPPQDLAVTSATVFLESIQKVNRPDMAFLLIEGNFPNGCTHLKNISHTINNQTLYLDFSAWQPKNRMCTQVLTPFSYLYEKISADKIRALRAYMVRGQKQSFN